MCVYVLHAYKTEMLRDISNISSNGLHQLWIKLQARNLYCPPDVPVTCFDTDLIPSLITASLLNKLIYILGNCNMQKPESAEETALANFCHCFNLFADSQLSNQCNSEYRIFNQCYFSLESTTSSRNQRNA